MMKTIGLIGGALSLLGFTGVAQAAPAPSLAAASFEDLLQTPDNAQALLRASDEQLAREQPLLQLVQDHHHHHRVIIRRPHHHHHHNFRIVIPHPRIFRRGHHHHHHHVIVRRHY